MTTKLTQALVEKAATEEKPGSQIYDDEVAGLRIVVGKRGASYKFVGRINDGSNRYVSIIIGRTNEVSLKSARTKAIELRLALKRGEDPRCVKTVVPTVQQACDRYLKSRGDELRPRTQEWYTEKVRGPLNSLQKTPIDKIDRETVRALHEKLTRNNGPSAANGAMRILKALINDVARTHDIGANPVSQAVRMHREVPRDWAVPPSEMPELWRRLDLMDHRVRRGCWMTMLLTGLRCGDARKMRWDQIDDDGILSVPDPKGGPTKAFKLPLPRLLIQELEEVRSVTRALESPYVFASGTSRSGHVEQMKRTTQFDYPPHAMRHTFRTMALEAGVDLSMTMVLMNHRPAGVSWNYVTRANLTGGMRTAIEKVASKIVSHR